MKIDAVELTLFAWDDIPPTKYTSGSQNQSGKSNLGLLSIKTDAGIEGNAFLGSATNPAETDAGALIRFLKPDPDGQGPPGARGPARGHAHAPAQHGPAQHRRLRHGPVGHRRQGRQYAALQIPGRREVFHRRLRLEPGARQPAGLRRGSPAVQGRRLEGLQDPSPAPRQRRHQGVRGRAQGCRRRLQRHARLHLELQISRRAARRPGHRGAGLRVVRGSAQRGGHLLLREAEAAARTFPSWPPSTRPATSAPTRSG